MKPLVLACAVAALTAAPPSQDPRRAPVVIDAVALDSANRPVDDLKAGDLEVWISGYRVPIARLTHVTPAAERTGRLLVVIMDDLTVPPALAPRVHDIARRFVDRMLPGDQMAVTYFDGRSAELTDDRRRLFEAIDGYGIRASGVWRFDVMGAQVLTTAATVARHLLEPADRRKTIVAIGSAALFDTPIPPPQVGQELRQEWTDAMRAMGFSNVSYYVIDPGGVGASRYPGGDAGFARETGGRAFVSTNDFDGAVDRVLREAGDYYAIEVADPPVARRAPLRKLEVRSLRRGIEVRARRVIPGTEIPDGRTR